MQDTFQEIQRSYWSQLYERWVSQEIGTFGWFFNIFFLAIIYIVWLKVVDKRRLKELLLFGALVSVSAGFVDLVAISIGLWEYKIRLVPLNPATFPFDYTVVPILSMMVLQYTHTKKSYILGNVIAAAIFAFVISPIYTLIGIKKYNDFNYLYMFSLVFSILTMTKYVYDWLSSIQQKHSAT